MDDFIYLDLNKEQSEKLGATWNQKRKMWRVPRNFHALKEVIRVFPHMKNHEELKELQMNLERSYTKLINLKNLEDAPGNKQLRPYQRVDVNYLKHLPNAAIFNEQRTGEQI